jgi:putative ABC transport system permease protein
MAAFGGWSVTLTGDGKDAERLTGTRVSWEFFRTLGLRPVLGRDFERQDDHPQRRRQVLLSDELWRRRFNGDRSIVGKPITVNGAAYTVIGVMPPVNELVSQRLYPGTAIWTLLGYSPELPYACRTCRHIRVIGRVKQDVPLSQAEADLTRVYHTLETDFPRDYSRSAAALTPVRAFFLGPIQKPLLVIWGAVGLLLLMTCANIANLLLIRASERQEEVAIRRALGVTSTRLLRQLLTESIVLALLGGMVGALLGSWATKMIALYGPDSVPRIAQIGVDVRVLGFAVAITFLTGVIFGMAPARMMIQKVHGVRMTADAAQWRFRAALIAVNVALSSVLLVGSGLLVRSFLHLLAVEPGFNTRRVLTFQVDLSGQRYAEQPAITQFYDELSNRLSTLTGVESVGASTQLPLTDSSDRWGVTIEGRPLANPAEAPEADRYGVTPGYFATMSIPLIRGRLLTAADAIGAPPVVVIGKKLADELWPGEDPLGHRVTLAGGPNNPPRTIVGIVGDVRHYGLHMPATIQAYMPRSQSPWIETSMTVVLRMKEGIDPLSIAGAARDQVRAIDPLQPVTQMRTYDAILAKSVATRRFTLALLAMFAGTALLLAIVGLYGALSYVVSQRQREIGLRVALGAAARDIQRMVVRQGMQPVIAGLSAGVALALGAGRVLQSLLFSVAATDLPTYMIVLFVVAASALAACVVPAARAASIDPATTLRSE